MNYNPDLGTVANLMQGQATANNFEDDFGKPVPPILQTATEAKPTSDTSDGEAGPACPTGKANIVTRVQYPDELQRLKTLGRRTDTEFLRPGFTVPFARCTCGRHHMWPTRGRPFHELELRCFDFPKCNTVFIYHKLQFPVHHFTLTTEVEHGIVNADAALGQPMAPIAWNHFAMKMQFIKK